MPDQRGDKQQPHAIALAATSVLSGGTRQRKTFLWTKKMDLFSEIHFLMLGAGNETRTRDPDLGKVVLYQLSYSRVLVWRIL